MKKLVALLLVLSLVACLFVGCSKDDKASDTPADDQNTEEAPETDQPEENTEVDQPEENTEPASGLADLGGKISFITDTGNIDDHSFNQYSYEGVTKFGEANGIETAYYRPTEDTDQARIDAINQAITDGSKVVVMAGYLFGPAVYQCATEHSDVRFLALDVSAGDLGEGSTAPSNLALITYKEEQAGYLAGYAAVKAGYTQLGFLGGIDVPAVVRYGYGFVQGADAAAAEDSVEGVNIKYWYSGSFSATDDIQTKMNGWYTEGTEVVFSCGGGIYSSAVNAADANDGYVIGVDVDQSGESDRIITSAMKALSNSVQVALTSCGENGWEWPADYAGQEKKLGAAEGCVGLPMETSKLGDFDQAAYDALFASITDGSLTISDAIDVQPTVTAITVDYQ